MFHDDRPIRTTTEDLLDRKKFAVHLAQAICQWGQRESLVIALNGEWGSGKSSIINMTVSHLEEKPEKDSIPTIIRFNPWIYSDLSSLTAHFFQEISQTLNIPNSGEKDKKLAEKIKLYASLLEAVPDRSLIRAGFDKVVTGLGLLGVSAGAIPNWFGLPVKWFNILLFAAGAALLLLQITRGSLAGLSRFLENRSRLEEKTAIEVKKDIESELLERDKKLLIIIDDLDRLTGREMVEMFRLIKANADFPNTIYLLAFDKGVVASHLDAELKTSGSKYLEKIVQIAFDVPQSGKEDVKKFFNEELQKIVSRLPESAQKYFKTPYWEKVYKHAIQHYLTNLRIVKRYLSSLEFNMMQLCSNNTMEVHPVDFIALEAIRQFEPEFFHYLKQHKELFTSVSREANNRRNEIYQRLGELIIHKDKEKHLIKLIEILFPQIGSNVEEKPEWSKELMVRSPIHFDSYFAYLPKGSSSEISQAELETVLEIKSKIVCKFPQLELVT